MRSYKKICYLLSVVCCLFLTFVVKICGEPQKNKIYENNTKKKVSR